MPDDPDWPTFTVPEGSGIPAGDGSPADAGATPPAPAPVGTAPVTPPDGTTPPAATGTPPPEPMLPKYRYDELAERHKQTQSQLERVTTLLQALVPLAKAPAAPQAPAAPVDPKRQALIDELHGLIPFWDDATSLLAKKQQIEETIERLERIEARLADEQKQRDTEGAANLAKWDLYAKETVAAIHAAVAPYFLPAGKTLADLPEFKKQTITDLFVRWISADEQRATRYDRGDATLREDFVKFFQAEMVDPFKRDSAAALAARARKTATLPVGGQTSSTLGTPPPKPSVDEDEDAIYRRAWVHTQDQLKSGV